MGGVSSASRFSDQIRDESMNLDNLNKWLTLAANLAILAGIVLLILEIQQNTRATNISSLGSTLSQYNHFRENVIRDREVAELWENGLTEKDLDGPDSIRYNMLVSELMFTIQAAYLGMREASITDDQSGTTKAVVESYMRYPGIRQWWLTNSRGRFTNDFTKYVDEILRDQLEST